jgi:hypothetical protein
MAEYADREHFIPLRRDELVDMLCADKGLSHEDREAFRQFCRMVVATYHFEYNQHLARLKAAYAPFDPDSDCITLTKCRADERQSRMNELFTQFAWLMERANFKHLSREDMEPALGTSTEWGLVMDVDFGIFERLAVFVRGDGSDTRTHRLLSGMYRKEDVNVPVWKRLAMIVKLRPSKRLGSKVITDQVYLQVFKNIPKLDICMLLPGARTRMSRLDKGKVGMPFFSGLAMALWNIADDVVGAVLRVGASPALFWGIATGAIGYGSKSYYNYSTTKQAYNLNLAQVLYYQNLDTNAGVLLRVIDDAEEQECREAILGYYFLWRHAGEKGWLARDLDDYIEEELERVANIKIDFEIEDALAKLEKLRIVEKVGDRYRAQPLAKALRQLDSTWDNYFKNNNPEAEESPVPEQKSTV